MKGEWASIRLKHTASNVVEPATSADADKPFIGLDAISSWTGAIEVRDEGSNGEVGNRFRRGDVLFGKLRPYLAKVAAPHFGGHCSGEALVIRPRRSLDQSFLFYLMANPDFINAVDASTYGAKMPRASWHFIGNMKFALPDLPTQKAIADFLDRETARIDLLIEKKQRFREMANERWRATLNHVVFPHSPDWGRLPDGWRKVQLKYLTDPKRPIMYGIVLPGPNMEEGPMIVKGGDVKPGRLHPDRLCRTTHEIEASYVRSRLRCGDLVISIRGGIGDIEIVPPEIDGANLTQDAARIAPRQGIDREWLRYALLSSAVFHPLESRSLGAAVRGINIFDLKRVFIPEPPKTQQTEIARTLARMESRLRELRELVKSHADRLREFRAALITAAVTGQIDPETWSRRGTTDRRLDQIEAEMGA